MTVACCALVLVLVVLGATGVDHSSSVVGVAAGARELSLRQLGADKDASHIAANLHGDVNSARIDKQLMGEEGKVIQSAQQRGESKIVEVLDLGDADTPADPGGDRVNAEQSVTPESTTSTISVQQCMSFEVSAAKPGGPPYGEGDVTAPPHQLRPQMVKGYLTDDCGISTSEADTNGSSFVLPVVKGWNQLAGDAGYRLEVQLNDMVYIRFQKYAAGVDKWENLTTPKDSAQPGILVAQKEGCFSKCTDVLHGVQRQVTWRSTAVNAREELATLLGCPTEYMRAVERNTTSGTIPGADPANPTATLGEQEHADATDEQY